MLFAQQERSLYFNMISPVVITCFDKLRQQMAWNGLLDRWLTKTCGASKAHAYHYVFSNRE